MESPLLPSPKPADAPAIGIPQTFIDTSRVALKVSGVPDGPVTMKSSWASTLLPPSPTYTFADNHPRMRSYSAEEAPHARPPRGSVVSEHAFVQHILIVGRCESQQTPFGRAPRRRKRARRPTSRGCTDERAWQPASIGLGLRLGSYFTEDH